MKYKVVPFVATLDQKNTTGAAAAEQLHNIVNKYAAQGWEYVRLESVTTFVAPSAGCFGLGAKPAYNTSRQMIVFQKNE